MVQSRVIIGQGLGDWAILQRDADGRAELHLRGTWSLPAYRQGETGYRILFSVRHEDTGEPVEASLAEVLVPGSVVDVLPGADSSPYLQFAVPS